MYRGEHVILRALEMTDIDHIMKFYNEWGLRRWTGVPLPKSKHAIEIWLEKASISDPWKDGVVYFVVIDKQTYEFLGIARFYDIKNPHHRASLGVSIYDPEHRMKGYGTDATCLMLWVGFHVLGLHSVYLDTMEDNERAIHVAEKAGFKKVGIFRETELIDGEYKGLLYMDILKQEFMSMYPAGRKVEEGPLERST
jgi:diamine N-acetyltransferase